MKAVLYSRRFWRDRERVCLSIIDARGLHRIDDIHCLEFMTTKSKPAYSIRKLATAKYAVYNTTTGLRVMIATSRKKALEWVESAIKKEGVGHDN